jgi:hypothetical protein
MPQTLYQLLSGTARRPRQPQRDLLPDPVGPEGQGRDADLGQFHAKVTQAANLFRSLGVGEGDVVAYILPNCNETAITLIGAAVARASRTRSTRCSTRTDRRDPARDEGQGRGHAQGLPQDRRAAEGACGRGARPERPDGARGRPQPLPRAAEVLDRAADPAEGEPRPQGPRARLQRGTGPAEDDARLRGRARATASPPTSTPAARRACRRSPSTSIRA